MIEDKTILQFNMKTLLDSVDLSKYETNHYEINDLVVFSEYACSRAHEEANSDKNINNDKITCHMLNQLEKALKGQEYRLNEILFILNFKQCKNREYNKLIRMNGDIALTINGKIIRIVEFLKSNSMSRNARIYYINKDYYDLLNSRLTFNLVNDNDIDLSRWYAYSGLTISDCIILDNVHLKSDEVVIVPDKEINVPFENVITAVSITSLKNDIEKLRNFSPNSETFGKIIKKFKEYKKSRSFESIESNDIKKIINTVIEYDSLEFKEYIKKISNLMSINEPKEPMVKWEMIRVDTLQIELNCFDGEGLISMELEEIINKNLQGVNISSNEDDYEDEIENSDYESSYSHSFQIRLPFIKGVVHSCDFKNFFKEHGIDKILGKTYGGEKNKELREYDVDKVKMILTESQFKLSKFKELLVNITKENEVPIDAYFRLLNSYDYTLGISNVEKHSSLDFVRLCYQFFSTMPLSKQSIKNIRESNNQYINKLLSPNAIIENLKRIIKDYNGDFDPLIERYKCITEAYELSPEYVINSYTFKNIMNKLIKNEINNTYLAKLDVKGVRRYLSGDLLGLLYHILKESGSEEVMPESEKLHTDTFYLPKTKYNHDKIPFVLLRNPHYARNEIKMLHPYTPDINSDRHRYFGHLSGVAMINPISDAADRLGGADYDGDTVIVTWDKAILNEIYSKLYVDKKEIYPLIKIPSIKAINKKFNHKNRIQCMQNTFDTKVGLISNICFLKTFESYNENNPDAIAYYTILNGLEIDSAKNGRKPFIVESKCPDNEYKLFLELKELIKNNAGLDAETNELKEKKKLVNNRNEIFFEVIKNPNKTIDLPKYEYTRNKSISLDDSRVIDLSSIAIAYSLVIKAIDRFKKRNRIANKNIDEIIAKGNKILIANHTNFDFETFAKSFIANDYNSKLNEYLIDKPYYMQGNDKLNELIKLDLGNHSNEYINTILNYNHDGFQLLYLIIYYFREKNRNFDSFIDTELKDFRNMKQLPLIYKQSIDNYEGKIRNMVEININDIRNELEDVSASSISDYISKLSDKVERYFKRKIRKYRWNDIEAIISFTQNNLNFTLFGNKLLEHLREENDNGQKN